MPYLYLIFCVLANASSSIFGKLFNRKTEALCDTATFYNFLMILSVFLGWGVLYAADFSFDVGVLPYSALFALCYTITLLGIIKALKHGSAALTSLLLGLSLLVTTVWGFFFWEADVTAPVIIGLVLVGISIALCLYSKEKENKAFSWKWLIYVILAFFGNAGCSIVQRSQQLRFDGQHGNMLMLVASAISALVYLLVYLKSNKRDTGAMLKSSWWIPVCAGVCNVALNALVILLVDSTLSPSLIYPVIGVGGLVVVTVFSLFIFKERMSARQWLGVAVGAVAVALLSI